MMFAEIFAPASRYHARVSEGPIARARSALSRGDVLIAYDEALTALEADPDDAEAHFVAALALARAGASERAGDEARRLLARIDTARDVPISLRADAWALIARLAKDAALAATGAERRVGLLRAAELYEEVAERFGGYFSCINAATLRLLVGDIERARELARIAQRLVAADRETDPGADYWREATAAEAALVLGDVDAAQVAVARAAAMSGGDLAVRAVTRHQLCLVCDAIGLDHAMLDELAPPTILHYCGHRIDAPEGSSRFPASMEQQIARQIREFVEARRVGFGYGSLASGADILIAEALLERGAQLHVVLPFEVDEFDRISVSPAGPAWSRRFRFCLAAASTVVQASDSAYMDDDELFGYAGCIAMGHALNRAAFLGAPAEQLAVWDRTGAAGVAGTAHDVAVWRKTGHLSNVIAVDIAKRPVRARSNRRASEREIGSILFSDFRGFSRLRDEQFPAFVHTVMAALAVELGKRESDVRWSNTWGDAIAAVFADVTAAADCALGFHDALADIDLASIGLPADLNLRIGVHAGPVMMITDPVGNRSGYWGRELTRAARIEPRTPEGEVYVTDAFAALVALEPNSPFVTEYVGRVTTAKDFETIPMYRLRRRVVRSVGEAL